MAIDTTEAQLFKNGGGEAIIWGQNKGLLGLERAYQQDQLRKQKEEAELADQVSRINYDAARNEDLPEIMNRYNGIKNTFAKIRGTQNQMERIKLQADLNQQKNDLTRAVMLSKKAAQDLGELGKLRLTHADEIGDDFVPNYKQLNSLSVFDPKFAELSERTASTAIVPKYDHISIAKKIADASIKKMDSGIKQEKVNGGTSSFREEVQTLDKDAVLDNVVLQAQQDKGLQRQISKLYPDVPYVDAVKAYADDLYQGMKGKYEDVKRTGVSVVKPDNWREKALFNDALVRGRQKDNVTSIDKQLYRQQLVEGMLNGVPGTGEEIGAIMKAKGGYDKGLSIKTYPNDPNKITITVPSRTISKTKQNKGGEIEETATFEDAKTLTFNKNKAEDKVKLNQLISDITGENVNLSKFRSGNPSGKVPVTNKPTKKSDPLGLF